MEKKQAQDTLEAIPHNEEGTPADNDWAPGFMRQFPWLGFGALFMVLVCMAGSVIVLVLSDDKSQDVWIERLAPNVLVNVMNSVANICFAIAIGNGIAIAWWRKTLKGATIEELHRSWSFSTSLKEIVFSMKYFNVIALAAITAKLAIVDSTLMQKATGTALRFDAPFNATVYGYANQDFPLSGTMDTETSLGGLLVPELNDALKVWDQVPNALPNTFTGCQGSCLVNIPAAGFDFQCDADTVEDVDYASIKQRYDELAAQAGEDGGFNVNETQKQSLKQDLFNIQFSLFRADPNTITPGDTLQNSQLRMDIIYSQGSPSTDGSSCPARKHTMRCFMNPTIVTYPVRIQTYDPKVGAREYIQVGSGENRPFDAAKGQQSGFEIGSEIKILEASTDSNSRLAGLWQGMNMYLGANSTILFQKAGSGAEEYRVTSQGKAAAYLTNAPATAQCNYIYDNPLQPSAADLASNIVQSINQMSFAWAMDAALFEKDKSAFNQTHQRTEYTAEMTKQSVHYVTNYHFMAGAIASTLLCVLLVLPSYWRFWQVGRKVTLGPLEIAHAFRSPMTAQAQSGNVDQLVKDVGHREIRYGHIHAGDAKGVVGVAEPEYVTRISKAGATRS